MNLKFTMWRKASCSQRQFSEEADGITVLVQRQRETGDWSQDVVRYRHVYNRGGYEFYFSGRVCIPGVFQQNSLRRF